MAADLKDPEYWRFRAEEVLETKKNHAADRRRFTSA
jgi:hypothetical protein